MLLLKFLLWITSFYFVVQMMVFYTLFNQPFNILVFFVILILNVGITFDLFMPDSRPINLKDWIVERKADHGGYVYILKDVEVTQTYKIGKTVRPYERMKRFAVELPFQTKLIHVIQCDDPSGLEAMLHRHFAEKRVRGEWFNLSQHDIDWLFQIYKA